MGFFDALKKMAQGKPVFEVPPQENKWHDPVGANGTDENGEQISRNRRYSTADGQKIVPEVGMMNPQPRYSGHHVELWVTIKNISGYPVFLDKSYIFGFKQELDYPLPPGGQREFCIYRGERRKDDSYKYAEVYYRDEGSGDYFCATHMIKYRHEADGTHDIHDLDLVLPIKDV